MEKLHAKDYRRMAKENCNGHAGKLVVVTLLDGVLQKANFIIGGPVALGKAEIHKKLYKKEDFTIGDLFSKFNRFGTAFGANAFIILFTFLWSLLLLIPGIIKQYAYGMTFYIMQDDESLTCKQAIAKSQEMMKGHKWELFCLGFSYIGWILLSCLTLGVLLFWVTPKMEQAEYCFYRHISGQDAVATVEVAE